MKITSTFKRSQKKALPDFPCVMEWIPIKGSEEPTLIVLFTDEYKGIALVSQKGVTGNIENWIPVSNHEHWKPYSGSITLNFS